MINHITQKQKKNIRKLRFYYYNRIIVNESTHFVYYEIETIGSVLSYSKDEDWYHISSNASFDLYDIFNKPYNISSYTKLRSLIYIIFFIFRDIYRIKLKR